MWSKEITFLTVIPSHPCVVFKWHRFPSGYNEPWSVKIIPWEHIINVLCRSGQKRTTGDFLIDNLFTVLSFKVSPEWSDEVSVNIVSIIATGLIKRLRERQYTILIHLKQKWVEKKRKRQQQIKKTFKWETKIVVLCNWKCLWL